MACRVELDWVELCWSTCAIGYDVTQLSVRERPPDHLLDFTVLRLAKISSYRAIAAACSCSGVLIGVVYCTYMGPKDCRAVGLIPRDPGINGVPTSNPESRDWKLGSGFATPNCVIEAPIPKSVFVVVDVHKAKSWASSFCYVLLTKLPFFIKLQNAFPN